jgi:methyl-accepting chemotaxis protein
MNTVRTTTFRVIGFCFFSVIICVGLYCLLLPLAINYDADTTIAFLKRMLIVGLLADVICTGIVYLVYRPTERALHTLDAGGTVSDADFRKAGQAMNFIPTFLFFFGACSYLAAYGINMTVDLIRGVLPPLDQAVSRIFGAISFGILNGMLTERLLNIVFIEVKIRFGIVTLEQLGKFQKYRSLRRRLMVPGIVLFCFIITFSGIAYFNLSKANGSAVVSAIRNHIAETGSAGLDRSALDAMVSVVEVEAVAANLRYFRSVLVVYLCVLVASIAVFTVFILEIHRNVVLLRGQLQAKGQGFDLSRRFYITCNDDLGNLAAGINNLMDNLSGTFREIRELSSQVFASSQAAGGLLAETRSRAEDLTKALKRVEGGTVGESSHIEGVARSVEAMTAVLADSLRSAHEQSATASGTLGRTKAFLEAFEDAGRESSTIEAFFKELDGALRVAGMEVHTARQAALETVEMGKKVSAIVSIISEVADRSSLLAMNASIEAAHAGSAGRGFAVVAKEIRNLAESSNRSAADINQHIQSMQAKSLVGVDTIERLTGSFMTLSDRIKVAGSKLTDQAAAFHTYSDEARQTMAGIQEFLELTRRVETASESQLHEQERIQSSIRSLESTAESLKVETENLLSGVRELFRLNQSLDSSLRGNFEAVEVLESRIGVYTLD